MIRTLDTARLKSAIGSQGITQSELVRKSGVSRAQVSRLLASGQPRVRENTLERLADALGMDPAELALGGGLTRFKQCLAQDLGTIDFRGIGMPSLQRQPIQDVFVDVDLVEDRGIEERDRVCPPTERSACTMKRPPGQPIPATECIRTHDRVVVLGHPGCGKTTVLRFLAYSCASRDEDDGAVPLYIRLPELCRAHELDERVDPVKFVVARAADRGCPDVEEALRDVLGDEKRPCLVLLDGLDEVGSHQQRDLLIQCVQEFIERYPRNRFAITSRVVGFESAPWNRQGFVVFRILGYNANQLDTFAKKWSAILARIERKPSEEVLETLQTAILSNLRVRALASNPLILTILVLLNEARGGALPRRRVDLYQKVVDVFLDTWESNKRGTGKFDDTYSIELDAREFRWLLSDLSLAMQKADRTLAARWWIAERMQEYLQQKLGFPPENAKDACDRIIRYLAERTGLIEERGLDLFGFSHRTLQEYFASLGVIDEADASRSRDVTQYLRGYYFRPQWPEVVRLVAAQLTPPLAESLVSSILDDPDPVGRFLRRGQLLALRCLSDGTTVPNRHLVTGVFNSLAELGRSRWLGVTFEAIDVLQSFAGTRLEGLADETVNTILETANKELDQEQYECLNGRVHVGEMFKLAKKKLPSDFHSEAARDVTITLARGKHRVIYMNRTLLFEKPDAWYSSACSILEDPNKSPPLKEVLVRELGRRVATDRRSRVRLKKLLCSQEDASVRAACAAALIAVTKGRQSARSLLVRVLNQDPDEEVRSACATALRDAAAEDASVADRLMEILVGDQSPRVRSGAARGLAECATSRHAVVEALQQCVSRHGEPDEVKVACAWALEPQIGRDPALRDTFRSWLDAPVSPAVQRIAAQTLATAMAEERLDWDRGVVEKVEQILMSLKTPCRHALESLEGIATAREIRQGLRIEKVLRDSLQPVADRIELAFVFGSTARNRQMEESDIDLFVMGDVNLRELSAPLREAERTLGRRINPAIYTRDSFREKFQAGNPFLLDVYRREKIPVMPPRGDSSQKDLDDELRRMVAKQLASTT